MNIRGLIDTQKTLGFIKPDLVRDGYVEEIMDYVQKKGFTIIAQNEVKLTREQAEEFYSEHSERSFFDDLIGYVTSGPVHSFVVGREKAVEEWRKLIGPTDPDEAKEESPGSIRALYGNDKTQNGVHGSDSLESARREIRFFFPDVLLDYLPSPDQYFRDNLKEVLSRGLTALAKAKPKNPIEWLSLWLKDNNPNKPSIMLPSDN